MSSSSEFGSGDIIDYTESLKVESSKDEHSKQIEKHGDIITIQYLPNRIHSTFVLNIDAWKDGFDAISAGDITLITKRSIRKRNNKNKLKIKNKYKTYTFYASGIPNQYRSNEYVDPPYSFDVEIKIKNKKESVAPAPLGPVVRPVVRPEPGYENPYANLVSYDDDDDVPIDIESISASTEHKIFTANFVNNIVVDKTIEFDTEFINGYYEFKKSTTYMQSTEICNVVSVNLIKLGECYLLYIELYTQGIHTLHVIIGTPNTKTNGDKNSNLELLQSKIREHFNKYYNQSIDDVDYKYDPIFVDTLTTHIYNKIIPNDINTLNTNDILWEDSINIKHPFFDIDKEELLYKSVIKKFTDDNAKKESDLFLEKLKNLNKLDILNTNLLPKITGGDITSLGIFYEKFNYKRWIILYTMKKDAEYATQNLDGSNQTNQHQNQSRIVSGGELYSGGMPVAQVLLLLGVLCASSLGSSLGSSEINNGANKAVTNKDAENTVVKIKVTTDSVFGDHLNIEKYNESLLRLEDLFDLPSKVVEEHAALLPGDILESRFVTENTYLGWWFPASHQAEDNELIKISDELATKYGIDSKHAMGVLHKFFELSTERIKVNSRSGAEVIIEIRNGLDDKDNERFSKAFKKELDHSDEAILKEMHDIAITHFKKGYTYSNYWVPTPGTARPVINDPYYAARDFSRLVSTSTGIAKGVGAVELQNFPDADLNTLLSLEYQLNRNQMWREIVDVLRQTSVAIYSNNIDLADQPTDQIIKHLEDEWKRIEPFMNAIQDKYTKFEIYLHDATYMQHIEVVSGTRPKTWKTETETTQIINKYKKDILKSNEELQIANLTSVFRIGRTLLSEVNYSLVYAGFTLAIVLSIGYLIYPTSKAIIGPGKVFIDGSGSLLEKIMKILFGKASKESVPNGAPSGATEGVVVTAIPIADVVVQDTTTRLLPTIAEPQVRPTGTIANPQVRPQVPPTGKGTIANPPVPPTGTIANPPVRPTGKGTIANPPVPPTGTIANPPVRAPGKSTTGKSTTGKSTTVKKPSGGKRTKKSRKSLHKKNKTRNNKRKQTQHRRK
jgi:hypothetical protein